jgi:hypothetical protein
MAEPRKPGGGPVGHSSTPNVRLRIVRDTPKPGMIDRRRRTNWALVAVLVGVLILWALIIVAVVREFA